MRREKVSIEIDNEYEDCLIKKVQGSGSYYEITLENGVSLGIKKSYNVKPKIKDRIRVYPKAQLGSVIRGIFINDKKVFYRTKKQQEAKQKRELEKRIEEKKKDYERHKEEYKDRINRLPIEFQDRIKRFQINNLNFGWDFLPYELFCCEQAVLFANKLKTIMALDDFYKMEWKERKKFIPELNDGHSGNTFGLAVLLAKYFITAPEMIVKEHGAMCPLVGCKEYGCCASEQSKEE